MVRYRNVDVADSLDARMVPEGRQYHKVGSFSEDGGGHLQQGLPRRDQVCSCVLAD